MNHDSTERLPSSSMNSQNHEGSARRLEVVGDLSPIFLQDIDKGNSQCSFYEYRICFKNPYIVSATWRGEPKEKKRTAITFVVV